MIPCDLVGVAAAAGCVVTDGAAPVRWCIGGESGSQPALSPPQVVDTTGAGDAFTAGLLHRGLLRWQSGCVLRPLVVPWSVVVLGALIPSPRRLKSIRFGGRQLSASTSIVGVRKLQQPSLGQAQTEPLGPFHRQQCTDCSGFFVFLQKDIVRCTGLFQAVEIEMNEGRIPVRVVLSQGEGGAGDRFADA